MSRNWLGILRVNENIPCQNYHNVSFLKKNPRNISNADEYTD
jgi:hypothetical protein